jgi:hypothetical protein
MGAKGKALGALLLVVGLFLLVVAVGQLSTPGGMFVWQGDMQGVGLTLAGGVVAGVAGVSLLR